MSVCLVVPDNLNFESLTKVWQSTIYHSTISLVSTMVNGILLNFGKRYEGDLRVIFDQLPKLHSGLDVLSNQKILKGVQQVFSYILQYSTFGQRRLKINPHFFYLFSLVFCSNDDLKKQIIVRGLVWLLANNFTGQNVMKVVLITVTT